MRACYDLSRYPANFNFVEFLVAAATLGATHVAIDRSKGIKGKYPKDETARRLTSIVEPACALAGCTFDYGSVGIDTGYHISSVLSVWSEVGEIKKLQTVKPAVQCDYTVTIRKSTRYPERNSGRGWKRFADEIGAVVIDEYDESPMHLHDRMALYAGAKMNYLVANGPAALLMFSDYPYTAFMKNVDRVYHARHGFPVGSQLPWANENQRCIWSDDAYEALIDAHRSR